MTRLVALLIATLLVFALLALTSHHKEPEERVEARATTTTVWPQESIPDLGEHFDQLVVAMKPKARTAPRPRAATYRAATAGPHRCGGGRLPSCHRMMIESGGNPRAVNPTGCGGRSCGGKWQFDPVTWSPDCTVRRWNGEGAPCATYQGYRFAQDAPEAVQDQRAEEVYAGGAGCSHWDDC